MDSMKLQFTDGGDDGYASSARSLGLSPPMITIESVEIGEFLSPVVSVSSPAISEQIADGSTYSFPPDTVSFNGDLSTGCGSEGGGNAVKKAVWSKPAKVVEVVGSVMDEVAWPALGELTKSASAKSSSSPSSESLDAVSDGSLLSALQVTGNSSPSSQKPASVDSTLTSNHVTNSGQRSLGRSGGVSVAYSSSNRVVSKGSVENHESKVESQSGKPATVLSFYPKDRGGFGSQSNSGNDNHYQRNSYWKGNGGVRPRGGGSYNNNYGGKVDHGRGNQDWNQHRNFNRNINMHSQRGGFHRGGYIRPPVHNTAPFFYPPMQMPVGPFGNNVMYPDVASRMNYFHSIAPPTVGGAFCFPGPDPLHDKIVNQINYYFSNDNLVKDTYLRRHMDEQGWVPVSLIARFNKVSSLTDNVQLILDVMQKSTVVEVQGDKMRRQNDWMRWLMPPSVEDSLGSQLQGIGLEERFSIRPSEKFFNQLQQGGGDRAQVA